MFNDPINYRDPDSYISGFPFMSNDDLSAFLTANELSFSLEQLIYIRDYFKNEKKMFPTYNQIDFFDALNKIRQSQRKGYSIYSATSVSGGEAILETSKDLLSKRGAIKRKASGAMPLSFASEIASEYLSHIGCAEKSKYFSHANSRLSSDYYIHTDDDIPLFVYSNPNEQKQEQSQTQQQQNNTHNALVMLCPIENIDYNEYIARADAFLSLPEINVMVSDQTTVKAPYGIFELLMKETNGLYVNLSGIAEIKKNEYGKIVYLTSLLSACIGRRIFSTNSTSVGVLNRVAEAYSLRACIFAVRNNSNTLTFEAIKNPLFSFDFSFLQKLMSFTDYREYLFCDENNLPLGARKNVYLTDNKSSIRQTYRAERIMNFGKVMASATSRELDMSPHKSAAWAVVDAINSLLAKGVSKGSIALSIHYSLLCGTDDGIELGKNLAAILGAYRTMIELCVSDNSPQISYNTKNRAITVLASAKPPKRPIKSVFSNGNTHVYFYRLEFMENGLPNYEKHREFITYFYSLIEKDTVLSAFAINENLTTVLESAAQNTAIEAAEAFDISQFECSHGILFEICESVAPLDNIYYVGSTLEK